MLLNDGFYPKNRKNIYRELDVNCLGYLENGYRASIALTLGLTIYNIRDVIRHKLKRPFRIETMAAIPRSL
jgi:hypothetical protein